ncbi:MAG TPA: fibronectin type III domain-containing protein, partial [Acidimicrobiales bacterium]|nr:fibronectin type III domain-containing protein [Acidimicrobiales bacterium]
MLRDRTLFGWHLRRADNGGFTLIEVAIAAFILMIAMVPVVDSMYGALSSASSDQALAGVSSIATEQLEKLTAVPYAQVGFYANVPGSSWQNQPAVDLGATGTSAIAPIATTTVQGTDVTIETFITWTNATVAASSGTSTTVDPDAYKQATVLVCWVPGSPHESLSSCTTSSSSVVQVAAGQQTVEQSTIIYPGGQGAYVGTTTSSSTTSTTTPIAPGAAGNVQASPASPGGNSQVNVTWSAPTSGGAATSYIVEWSTTPSFTSYAPSNPIGAPVTSDLVSGLSPSTTYYFLVIAYDYWVAGPASSQASATTQSSSTTTTSS